MLTVGKRVILVVNNEEKDYVFLGVESLEVDSPLAFFYPYSKDILDCNMIEDNVIVIAVRNIAVKREKNVIPGIKFWYLKNRLLLNLPILETDVIEDCKLKEINKVVGCQYLGFDGKYRIYLGYQWFLVLRHKITEEELKKLDNFSFSHYSYVTREEVKGFKIKIKDYPLLEQHLQRVKENQRTALRWIKSK